jgi:hypothetical protein
MMAFDGERYSSETEYKSCSLVIVIFKFNFKHMNGKSPPPYLLNMTHRHSNVKRHYDMKGWCGQNPG